MIVTYIYHSCYLIEFEGFSVIFDFYQDAKRDDGSYWVQDYFLNKKERLYVFCTHSHADHFNPEILDWKQKHPNIQYIFSKEIAEEKRIADKSIVFLDKLDVFEDDNLKVTAFGSTDVGHSFLLQVGDKHIFHAGDLNNWHWNEEVPKPEATTYETNFLCELELLAENTKDFFLAMFPIDPRLGKDYKLGAEQFVKRFSVDYFLPMHFGDNFDKANAFKRYANLQNCHYLEVHKRGQTFQL